MKSIILYLMISVMVFLTSCRTESKLTEDVKSTDLSIDTVVISSDENVTDLIINETSETTNEEYLPSSESSLVEFPVNDYNNECWNKIKTYSSSIGKTFSELLKEKDVNYKWFVDNTQSVFTMDYLYIYFPQLIWDGTVCTAVAVPGDYILPEDVTIFNTEKIESYFGDGYTYHPATDGAEGYYEYELEDYNALIVETPKIGTSPAAMYILIRSTNEAIGHSEVIDNFDSEDTISEPQERVPDIWDGINGYIEKIGKDKSEVLNSEINWVYDNDWGYYRDPNSNVGYGFDNNDKCYESIFPMKVLIGENNNQVFTIKEMSEFFNLPFSWRQYEGERYVFFFQDITVYIHSDNIGQVDADTLVTVMKSDN